MAEGNEECEWEQLMPADDSTKEGSKSEVTPPMTPGVSKDTQTSPTSPVSNKMSTSSVRASQGSSTKLSNKQPSNHATKFLYVNEKMLGVQSNSSVKLAKEQPCGSRTRGQKRACERACHTDRPCQHHCFLTDVTDVRQMEQSLLQLLEDFHSGKLRAFGKDCSMEQMEAIREQQERLAKLHFDLGAQQELFAPLSDEGLRAGQENMHRLIDCLEQLSVSIERLHSFSSESRDSSVLGM